MSKISNHKSQKPKEKNKIQELQRIQNKFKLVTYQIVETLYLREYNRHKAKRVLAKDEIYDVLEELHMFTHEHSGRTKLFKRVYHHYLGVTEEMCCDFVKLCPTRYLKKSKKSVKSVVTKPIVSTNYLSRGQVDIIDFSDMNLIENMSPDGVTPYKYFFSTLTILQRIYFSKYSADMVRLIIYCMMIM